MRHKVDGRLFGRPTNQRKALLRNLVASLIEHQRIETTVPKAKEAKRIAERLVSLAIKGDLASRRLAMTYLPNRELIGQLFKEIGPRFVGRNGGYLRIVRTRRRVNDRAELAVLEFVDYEDIKKKETEKTKEDKENK